MMSILADRIAHRLAPLQVDEGFAKSGDNLIHYRCYGSGSAILFQHGFPDNELTFVHQVEELAKDHLIITPTLRGYPPSSIPSGLDHYTIPALAEDIGAVLDHLAIGAAVLAGHDWGGVLCQAFASAYPDRVDGLIILNSPILGPFLHLVNHDAEQQKLSEYTLDYLAHEEGDVLDIAFVTRTIRDDRWRAAINEYLQSAPIDGMLNYYKMGYPAPPYGAPDPPDRSPFICPAPALIVWGLEDEYFSLKVLNNLWDWFTESYRLVTVPGAGHWVFRDEPEKINAEIRSWLAAEARGLGLIPDE
ncbi:alpha/beta fold hydrolase [Mycobacterium sp. AZCC_0083]|uniref:alpha/beta fold hydrolase n=1 Tax=Mycobacterium sp. AZCC_0083 TaxID=2735882 RepID=UPI0016145565|nr:alpha/beta hydrolase [Mycobacterium sp. AZCC_0083]MBB5167597.1 pimeloyl-ACP methyl ester carboxylesterase [Mycobacterium sp. AZCC_0083]